MMIKTQSQFQTICATAATRLRTRLAQRDERGEVTATTALIFLLVVAAIAAGGVIATRITGNANRVPTP
jgi:carbon starvation protein CstA